VILITAKLDVLILVAVVDSTAVAVREPSATHFTNDGQSVRLYVQPLVALTTLI